MSSLQNFFFARYLSEGDNIRAVFHRHFFVALPNIFFWLAVPVCGVSYTVYRWYPDINSTHLWIFEAYIFGLFFLMIYKVLDWYCDAWIVTDRGMIDIRWSLFTRDMIFTEFHDISGIQSYQWTLFDKMFDIGDITLHKMGDEMRIMRMYQPDAIVDAIESNLQEHHHEESKPNPDMHIYLDWVRQTGAVHPYKNGFRYSPVDGDADTKFVEQIRNRPGTIDLSGATPKTETKNHPHSSHGGHHGH